MGQRSNSMLTALRGKNMALYEKVQLCETWKMRALLKIVSNAFEARTAVKGHMPAKHRGEALYLDGLQYTNKELKELCTLLTIPFMSASVLFGISHTGTDEPSV